MSIRSIFASDKREVNGQSPPPVPRNNAYEGSRAPRAPMLPMAMPEQQRPAHLHPTTYALDQLDAALQEIRKLEGHIEGQNVIIDDLRAQLKEARRDKEMYRGFSLEIGTHLNYVMDAAREANSCAMKAAERSAKSEAERQEERPQDLDEAIHTDQSLEEQLREVNAEVQAATEAPAPETKT